MYRIVFPTNQKMSYLSKVESNIEESEYLTILNVKGQTITEVETFKNPHPHNNDELIKECKDNKFKVLILPSSDEHSFEEFRENGIAVFKTNEEKTVLNAFNDFVQDKLLRVS